MPIKINTCYEKCYPSRLKKYFQSNFGYNSYIKFVPKTKRQVVGNLPPEIIKLFPKETRGQDIKTFQDILGETADVIRNSGHTGVSYSHNSLNISIKRKGTEDAELATEYLNKAIKKYFNLNLKAKLSYTDYGAYKEVFKLSLYKDNNKIMHDKAFHLYRNIEPIMYPNKHGNYAESNMWIFLKHRIGHSLNKTQFTNHYISDMKNGYALTEFVDKEITPTTSPVNIYKTFGIVYTDSMYNPLKEAKIYDVGGFSKTDLYIDDKIINRFYKKIINRGTQKERIKVAQDLEKLIKNPKTPHKDKIRQAIIYYKKQFPYEYKSDIKII